MRSSTPWLAALTILVLIGIAFGHELLTWLLQVLLSGQPIR